MDRGTSYTKKYNVVKFIIIMLFSYIILAIN